MNKSNQSLVDVDDARPPPPPPPVSGLLKRSDGTQCYATHEGSWRPPVVQPELLSEEQLMAESRSIARRTLRTEGSAKP